MFLTTSVEFINTVKKNAIGEHLPAIVQENHSSSGKMFWNSNPFFPHHSWMLSVPKITIVHSHQTTMASHNS